MAKKTIHYTQNHQAELGKVLRSLACRHGLWQVFRDFVAMAAIAMSNAVDKNHFTEREADYMKIVGRYTKEEANELAGGLAHVVFGLENGMCDFMGSLFMGLELGDSWKGQFFTPYEICRLMSMVNLDDNAKLKIDRTGFLTVCDPCVGAGAMIIAAAHALHDAGINYQRHMHAVAIDIDIVAVHMAYIQFSLLHIPAVIYHGNSLSNEVWSVWHTPAHVLGFWDSKLRRAAAPAAAPVATAEAWPVDVSNPDTPPMPTFPPHFVPPGTINIRGQIALF